MAKKTIHISDLSGKEVEEGKGATITIKFTDARKGIYVLDVTDAEAEDSRPEGPQAGSSGSEAEGGCLAFSPGRRVRRQRTLRTRNQFWGGRSRPTWTSAL